LTGRQRAVFLSLQAAQPTQSLSAPSTFLAMSTRDETGEQTVFDLFRSFVQPFVGPSLQSYTFVFRLEYHCNQTSCVIEGVCATGPHCEMTLKNRESACVINFHPCTAGRCI
jgi:hypothetical protein